MLALTKTTTSVTGRVSSTQQQRSRRAAVVVASAQSTQLTSRRVAMTTLLGLSAAILSPATPANAFLGIGEDPSAKYVELTQKMIDTMRAALQVQPNTDEREAAMKGVKEQTVAWVSDVQARPQVCRAPVVLPDVQRGERAGRAARVVRAEGQLPGEEVGQDDEVDRRRGEVSSSAAANCLWNVSEPHSFLDTRVFSLLADAFGTFARSLIHSF